MGVSSYQDLRKHLDHHVVVVVYGDDEAAAIECVDCSEVLVDFDNLEAVKARKDEKVREKLRRKTVGLKAAQMWASFDENKKRAIRFGLFPHEDIATAEAEGYNGHEICVCLMDQATLNGGMRA